MTNPNDAVGTPAAYDGRSSVKSFNDTTGAFTRGIISGWDCSPKAGMTVQIGGDGSHRDIAVAEDNAGNRTTIDNISESPIDVVISGAPSTGNRIDLIVAYVDANPQGDGATPDNPDAVGFITVSGTAASTPSAPDDTAIRSAITSDGATGASAYYVVLASIYVGTSITTIGAGAITQGTASTTAIGASSVADGSITTAKLATNAVSTGKVANGAITNAKLAHDANFANEVLVGTYANKPLYRRILTGTSGSATNTVNYVITTPCSDWGKVISIHGIITQTDNKTCFPMDGSSDRPLIGGAVDGTNYKIYEQHPAAFYSSKTMFVTIEYTKA